CPPDGPQVNVLRTVYQYTDSTFTRLKRIGYPDSRSDLFEYATGTFSPGLPGIFMDGPGTDSRTSITHTYYASQCNGDATADLYRSTRDTTVTRMSGLTMLELSECAVFCNYILYNGNTLDWTEWTYDSLNRPQRIDHADGTYEETVWDCCRPHIQI